MSRPGLVRPRPRPMRWTGIRRRLWEVGAGGEGSAGDRRDEGRFLAAALWIRPNHWPAPWTLPSPTSGWPHSICLSSSLQATPCEPILQKKLETGVENLYKEPSSLFWASQNSEFLNSTEIASQRWASLWMLEEKWATSHPWPLLLLEVSKFLLLIPEFTVENWETTDKPKEANKRLGGLFQMSTVLFWPEGTAFLMVVVLFFFFPFSLFLSSFFKLFC